MGLATWRLLPAPVRKSAHLAVQNVGRRLIPLWVWWRRRGLKGEPQRDRIDVVGLFSSQTGIGGGARAFAAASAASGFKTQTVDAGAWIGSPAEIAFNRSACENSQPLATVTHLNPRELEIALQASRGSFLNGRRHIGYWAWELPDAPHEWRRAFRYVDQVWAPSHFTAEALRRIAPAGKPVFVCPHLVRLHPSSRRGRETFGLLPQTCVVLSAFDLKSTVARKHPYGALEAFLQAVPRPTSEAAFVLKVSGGARYPALLQDLRSAFSRRSDLHLLEETLQPPDMSALIKASDIVLSLHRSEGFGLLLAEAMLAARPVVATGWSGNMDFMDEASAALVQHRLIPVRDPQGMYTVETSWADPNIEHAATLLARLIGNKAHRQALGLRGQRRAQAAFNETTWRANIRSLLAS